MGVKKAANLFRIYCFVCRCGAAGYSVFMLSVKPELEQAFNQLCSDVVLHIRVIIAVHFGKVADISGVVEQDSVHGFWVALTGFEDCFIGEKSTHTGSPPFLRVAAARQAGYAAPLCCVTGQYTRRSRAAAGAESNSAGFLPASAPAKQRSRRQGRRCRAGRSDRRR